MRVMSIRVKVVNVFEEERLNLLALCDTNMKGNEEFCGRGSVMNVAVEVKALLCPYIRRRTRQ